MECLMQNQMHARFLSANQQLRDFLRRAEALAKKRGTVSQEELKTISRCLLNLSAEVGDASRSETLDTTLQAEIAEYVKNLKAFVSALEKIRSAMVARRVQTEAAKRRTDGLQSWIEPHPQTT
jgi:hypothetical protein